MTQQEQKKFRAIMGLIDTVRECYNERMRDPLLWRKDESDKCFEDLKAGVEKIFQRQT